MSVSNLSWLKKKSQSVDITAPGFNPLGGAGKQAPQASKPPAPKTPIIEEEQNNSANTQKHPSRKSELKRFYTIDTGQKKTLDKKDGRRMSFQKPKGTIEYTVESRDSLNSIALKFDTTPNELVQLNKLFSRAVVTGQVLYVPDPEYVSSVESSPSLSPVSPLSPTSSEAEFDKATTPDVVHPKEAPPSSTVSGIRPARVVSSTSEEEEAFTEKFLKINCKYITNGKGTVSGVLLVTPNNIMFDPHKTDPLVQENGCEDYGIMCPMEEVMSAAMYKEILDSKIKESLPTEIDPLSGRGFCHSKKMKGVSADEMDSRVRDPGNDSASTAPRSTEESLSEDVFTESELSPIREELLSSELRQDKSSDASSESVQTVSQIEVESSTATSESATIPDHIKSNTGHSSNEVGALSHETDLSILEIATKEGDKATEKLQEASDPEEQGPNVKGHHDQDSFHHENSLPQDGGKENVSSRGTVELKEKQSVQKSKRGSEQKRDSETEVEELRKLWKSHSMQQAKQQRDTIQQVSQRENKNESAPADGQTDGSSLLKEKRRHRLHKFLCLRVGKPMRKTFVSQASATMQQYAQRDKKHEYWFAVPQERTDHLYAFFIQWSPEIYAEDTGEYTREPGFIVVKKIEESETNEDPSGEAAAREWEVVSVAEHHRRIDALNTEELRTLCRRLQITTREDVNSKQAAPAKADLEPESFRPNLSDPSDLLLPDQIEKLTKHLPPRTIGYPWTLVYGTGKHGTSLKTLYRTMTGLDTPVLMVIKDSDGQVFGALASEPFKVSDGFYGTGETFVFTFCPEFEVFKWTGDNMFFIKGDMDSLAFGGGGGEFALWLDGDLYHGRSHSCKTFGNHTLSKKEDFFIQDIEIWAFE
ncbi:oxidation resistance protein 1 isoform X3 [Psammomys obesus]|uniref:oxidation resistance protein 1 isoform X3 n=1 Tax=Psammomys obesus TaxID=48139 RepID=UPI00245351C8|nr:oxidation resistance protein 1 isoform X3 [Psammomys obesus]XP_055482252.1 oxidation resistance protein 1 isoform X3 [Psammomys obesus]